MNKFILLAVLLIPLTSAYADITLEGDNFELSDDCMRLGGDNLSITSEDCASGKHDSKHKDNASVHGGDNPGKGHDKDKKDKKEK